MDEGNPYASLETPPPQRSSLLFMLGAVAVVAMAFAALIGLLAPPPHVEAGSLVGTKLPSLQAEGWINGGPLTNEQLLGKVVVVDAWAYWCGPCARAAPELVALYEKYQPQGVQFIGLTSEGADNLALSQKFLEQTHIPWPNAYGAMGTLEALKAEFIPQVWIVDRTGTIVWDERSSEDREEALARAVAAK